MLTRVTCVQHCPITWIFLRIRLENGLIAAGVKYLHSHDTTLYDSESYCMVIMGNKKNEKKRRQVVKKIILS